MASGGDKKKAGSGGKKKAGSAAVGGRAVRWWVGRWRSGRSRWPGLWMRGRWRSEEEEGGEKQGRQFLRGFDSQS